MSQHLAIAYSIAGTAGPSTGRSDVLTCELTHDPLRTPQIVVQATIPFGVGGAPLDDKSREPANLYIQARTYNAGTLREFDAAAPPATLGELEWSDKASDPLALDGLGLDFTETTYELNLFCTKKVSNPKAGTVEVTLASADYLLGHLANAGAAWTPAKHADGNYRLKSALRQLLEYTGIPLTVPVGAEGDVIFAEDEMKPWEPGQTALDWLSELRAAHGSIWMVSALERTMQPYFPPAEPAPSLSGAALEQTIESGTDVSEVTGFARWCDGYLIVWEWTDDADVEHVVRDFASIDDKPWQDCRKINVERFDRAPTSLTAASRLARAQQYDLQTTWEIPQASLPEPYLDLSTWVAMRGRLADLTYHYPAATVSATQTKE